MTHIRLAGIIAITLSLAVLDARSQGPGNDKGSQVTQAPSANAGDNSPTTPQDQSNANDPHDKDHDKDPGGSSGGSGSGGKWRTSATEIGTLGLLGASLLLASIYLVRRRGKARV